jgi:hypothetical protein
MRCTLVPSATIAAAAALALAACSGSVLDKTVDSKNLHDVSRAGQLSIYDSENEVAVALNRLDEAKETLSKTRRRLEASKRSLQAAEKRGGGAVETVEAWREALRGLEKWARSEIEAADEGVTLALAGVELVKAQVIHREDLLGGKGFSIKAFQDQFDSTKARYDELRKEAAELRKAARKLEQEWWIKRNRHASQSGDYDSGLWID